VSHPGRAAPPGRKWALAFSVLVTALGMSGAFALFGMEVPAQIAVTILLVAATLWITEAVPLFVASFVVLALNLLWLLPSLTQAGADVSATRYLAPFFSDIILLFLGGFVLSAALNKQGLDEQLARYILRRTGHSVPLLIASVMATTALFSMWLSNTATAALMLALCVPIAQRLPASDRYRKAIVLAVPFGANVGGLATPIGTPPNAIAMRYMNEAGIELSFGRWLWIGLPGTVGMLVVAFTVLMLLYKGQAREIDVGHAHAPAALGAKGGWVLGISGITALGWMTSGVTGLSVGTVSLFPLIAFFGSGFMKVGELKTLSWDVLLVMGGGLSLGQAIESSGLAAFLVGLLPAGGAGVYLTVVVFGAVGCAMSSLMSNTATANLLMPVVLGMSGNSVPALLLAVAFGCSLAMPLPISTPPNAMAFSTGELRARDLLVPGLITTLLGLLLTYTVGFWWWHLAGAIR
jgi:solute carrier family 13 (sodium-dependent dicarboxylate transporter), member 2/3/5